MSKYTPGPWKWIVNPHSKRVCLQSFGGKRDEVLTFKRWGTQGAQPWFVRDGLFRDIMEFFKIVRGREHHADWYGTIEHPDAQLIETAPELLEICKEMLSALDGSTAQVMATAARMQAIVNKAELQS